MRLSLSRPIIAVVTFGVLAIALAPRARADDPSPDPQTLDVFCHPLGLAMGPGVFIPTLSSSNHTNQGNNGNSDDPPDYPDDGLPDDVDPGTDHPGGATPPPLHHNPEPSTLVSALLGIGSLGVFGWRRRRRA